MQHLTACCELYAALNYLLCYSGPLQQFPMTDVCSEYALDLSNNGPVQSSTLIKNDGTLPLTSNAAETVAVIGPNSNLSKSDVSYYGPRTPCGANYWTMIDAVTEHSSQKVITALGVPSVSSSDTSGIAAAVEMAKTADVVILAVGTDLTWAHEEHDASSMSFTQAQAELIANVSAAAKKTILVTFTATPLDLTEQMANPNINAIMHVGQPSVTIVGVGELIFGKQSPAGRLVQTIYPSSYADQVSIFDFNMRPGPSLFPRPDCAAPYTACTMGTNPGRTHRFYTGKAMAPFGFGERMLNKPFLNDAAECNSKSHAEIQNSSTHGLCACRFVVHNVLVRAIRLLHKLFSGPSA